MHRVANVDNTAGTEAPRSFVHTHCHLSPFHKDQWDSDSPYGLAGAGASRRQSRVTLVTNGPKFWKEAKVRLDAFFFQCGGLLLIYLDWVVLLSRTRRGASPLDEGHTRRKFCPRVRSMSANELHQPWWHLLWAPMSVCETGDCSAQLFTFSGARKFQSRS